MVTVGITGGIGSGKSTVCKRWADLGAYVLNADELAKKVMTEHPSVRQQLTEHFGKNTFLADGALNREYLAAEAFQKGRVEELNAIVHPRLPEEAVKEMEKARQKGHKVFVYEAALLLENLAAYDFDYIVLVLAEEKRRIERVLERDGSSRQRIRQRITKQRNFDESEGRADFIIHNDRTLEELKKKSEQLYQNFLT